MRKGICWFLLGAYIFVPIVTEHSVVVADFSPLSPSSVSWNSHKITHKRYGRSILSDSEYKFHQQQPPVPTSYGNNGIPKIQGQGQADEGTENSEFLAEGSSGRSRFPAIPASASGASAANAGVMDGQSSFHSQHLEHHGAGERPEQLISEVKVMRHLASTHTFLI